jgi:hypothetical protein
MLTAQARRADADDAVVRAEMARTTLEQARERLAAREREGERRHASAATRRTALAPPLRRCG